MHFSCLPLPTYATSAKLHMQTGFIALKYFLRRVNYEGIRNAAFFQSCYLLPLLRTYVPQHPNAAWRFKKNLFPLLVTDKRLIKSLAFKLVISLKNIILTSEIKKGSISSNF